MQLVISAFPGTGKSTISNNAEQYGLIKANVHYDDREGVVIDLLRSEDKRPVFDSDSSIFPKDGFPTNYVNHIKGLLRDFPECVIMVSSHDNVREALRENGIDYILVYPQRELKGDYLERYENRGSPEAFVTMMDNKWNDFIDSCEADPSSSKRVLSEGEFLVDKIEELKKFWPAPAAPVNEAFPTAVISGTESIGDIVCDAEGKPVAGWGPNGLEPLPEGFGSTPVVEPEVVVVEPAPVDAPSPVAAIFSAVTEDAPLPEPTLAPAPEVVDLVALTTEDIPIVAAVPEPEVAAVVVPDGTQTSDVVSIELAPADVPVSGEAIVAGNEDGDNPEIKVDVDPDAGNVEVETPDGTVTVTTDEVKVEGPEITVTEGGEEIVQTDPDRSDIIELKLDVEADIEAIEPVVAKANEEDRGGLESLQDGSQLFIAAAAKAKDTYGIDMEPTLAGLEGFLDGLKGALGKIKSALSGKSGSAKPIIKRTISEAESAGKEYTSADWLGKQQYINVGKAKIPTPAVFKDASSIGDIETIVNMISKQVVTAQNKYAANVNQRAAAGLKIYNKYKGTSPDDKNAVAELSKITITPEELTGAIADSGLKNVDLKTSSVELPVLNKDAVKEAGVLLNKVMINLAATWELVDKVQENLLPEEELYKSAFWDEHINGAHAGKIWDAITYEASSELGSIGYTHTDVAIAIAKFLEAWIINSVK